MNKVYGPYRRKDGRQHVVHYDGQYKRTQSYPQYLMEQHLGRELKNWEQVDHINNDPTDDRIENFQILTIAGNNKKSVKYHKKETKWHIFICPICFKSAKIPMNRFRYNQIKQCKAGPYCSRSCAGKAHN